MLAGLPILIPYHYICTIASGSVVSEGAGFWLCQEIDSGTMTVALLETLFAWSWPGMARCLRHCLVNLAVIFRMKAMSMLVIACHLFCREMARHALVASATWSIWGARLLLS